MGVNLPGWKVVHTGGGVFVAACDFPLADGGTAAVTVTDDSACLHGRADGSYLTSREWLDHEEAGEEEIGRLSERGGVVFTPGARDLLGEEALREIARAMEEMARL